MGVCGHWLYDAGTEEELDPPWITPSYAAIIVMTATGNDNYSCDPTKNLLSDKPTITGTTGTTNGTAAATTTPPIDPGTQTGTTITSLHHNDCHCHFV
jgi:hypothetical protein